MKINNKKRFSAGLMTTLIAGATFATTAMANATNTNNLGTPEQQADITNWIANTPTQVSNNMAMQHINTNNLNGVRYVIQWGDTLSSISAATGISVAKLCYDNHIENANFIYAGNVLILNKDGYVPDDYQPHVDPYAVAQTKVTINNGPTFVNIDVQPGAIKEFYDNSDNSNHSTNIYKAGDNNSSQGTTNNSGNDSSKSSSDDSSSNSSDSVSASTVVDSLNKANSNDKLSFTEGSDGTELSISSDDIAKAVKDDDYSSLLDEITSALDSDKDDEDVTISISGDGDDLHVYASYSKSDDDDDKQTSDDSSKDEDSQSSDKDDEDQDSQSSDDEDSQSDDDDDNNKADTNDDEDTDTTTDDE